MALERALEESGELFRDDEEKATFLRRLKRALKKPIHQASSEELLAGAIRLDTEQNDTFPFTFQKLKPLAEKGSVTAMGLLQSALYCVAGNDALARGDLDVAALAFAEAYRKNSSGGPLGTNQHGRREIGNDFSLQRLVAITESPCRRTLCSR